MRIVHFSDQHLSDGTLLLLDTVVPGEEWGEVAAAQLAWLDEACPQGRPARIAPSPAHQIALQDGPLARTLEPGGCLVHDWLPGELLLTHYVPADRASSPADGH